MVKTLKNSMVNGQTTEKNWSKFWPVVAAVTMESIRVTPTWYLFLPYGFIGCGLGLVEYY